MEERGEMMASDSAIYSVLAETLAALARRSIEEARAQFTKILDVFESDEYMAVGLIERLPDDILFEILKVFDASRFHIAFALGTTKKLTKILRFAQRKGYSSDSIANIIEGVCFWDNANENTWRMFVNSLLGLDSEHPSPRRADRGIQVLAGYLASVCSDQEFWSHLDDDLHFDVEQYPEVEEAEWFKLFECVPPDSRKALVLSIIRLLKQKNKR